MLISTYALRDIEEKTNELVYQLYDLKEPDIKIIEEVKNK